MCWQLDWIFIRILPWIWLHEYAIFRFRNWIRFVILSSNTRIGFFYATDLGVSEENVEDRIQWLQNEWRSDWSYFATDSLMSSRNVEGEFRGLDLDEEILRKLFYSNALQWYPGAFK